MKLRELKSSAGFVDQERDYLLVFEPRHADLTFCSDWRIAFWDAEDNTFRSRADSRVAIPMAQVQRIYELPDAEIHVTHPIT